MIRDRLGRVRDFHSSRHSAPTRPDTRRMRRLRHARLRRAPLPELRFDRSCEHPNKAIEGELVECRSCMRLFQLVYEADGETERLVLFRSNYYWIRIDSSRTDEGFSIVSTSSLPR
jgi:hypothetical protein